MFASIRRSVFASPFQTLVNLPEQKVDLHFRERNESVATRVVLPEETA